jgi:hypothetical protein
MYNPGSTIKFREALEFLVAAAVAQKKGRGEEISPAPAIRKTSLDIC